MLIDEGYRLIKQISKGGFYQTFLAVDESQFPPIPCVVYQVSSQYQSLEIFQFQVQTLMELGKHPQIPTLITHFTENKYYYLIQEFIDGDNLASLLAKQGVFHETQIWQILKSLLPVIRFIHDHQVIHGNIQPENIILRTKNQSRDLLDDLVLGNFANMKFANINEDKDNLVGSPEYISPEQAQGEAVFASDLYSLGVTCIYLLTQISPFELFDMTNNSWVWRDYLTDQISEHLGQTLDKLVKYNLQERWQSADQLIYNLGIKDNYLPLSSLNKSHLWQLADTLENQIHSSINTVALSHDGKILASGEDNKNIKLWNLSNQQLMGNFPGHSQSITAVIFNDNDTVLATASNDQTINLWDVKTLTKIHSLTGHSHAVKSLAFHPCGQILASGSWDKTIKIWDVNTGLALNTLTGHKLQVNAVAFSPQGQLLASASYDRTVRVWKLEDGKFNLLTTLLGHSWSVVAVVFSADGETLISGSWDKTVKIWQISTKSEIASLVGHTDSVSSVVMRDDGGLIISGSKDKTIKLWRR